jgi:hypothetical protein
VKKKILAQTLKIEKLRNITLSNENAARKILAKLKKKKLFSPFIFLTSEEMT